MKFHIANLHNFLLSILLVVITMASESTTAIAGVVLRDINVTLDAKTLGSYDLDVDLDGSIDFTFENFFSDDPTFVLGFDQTRVPFSSQNGVVIDSQPGDGFPPVSLLSPMQIVSSSSLFSAGSFDLGNLYSAFPSNADPSVADISGNFGGQTGYLGFQFESAGGLHYGYALVTVEDLSSVNPFDLTIQSIGYENVAGQSIAVAAVPEPSSILLVLLTGYGIIYSRKKLSIAPEFE